MEVSISTTDNDLDPKGFIIGIVIVAACANKYILPELPRLKSEFISLFFNWIFYTVIFVSLFIAFLCWRAYLKRKAKRLRRREIAERKWREEQEKEEQYKRDNPHLFPGTIYECIRKANELKDQSTKLDNNKQLSGEFEEEELPRKKSIHVNLSKEFHKRKNYNKDEIEYLLTQDYQAFKYKSICTGKVESYLLRPRFNESLQHMIVIYDLEEYLKKRKINCEKYTTRMPDIVIFLKKGKIAIEVETGTVIKNMKKFREKMRLLKENYRDNFYFIVTNRNLIKKYRQYGKVIDPRYIKGQIDKILKNSQK